MERDLIGVGAGPANLSLASLLTTARERGLASITATFFEREANVFWHSLQMFPGTLMQTEFYRDLVTPIDPTSRFSFLNYLKAQARLDQFLCSSTIYPTRREFEDYFRWVAGQIGDVILGVAVNRVDYDAKKKLFVVDAGAQGGCETKHIVFGCGGRPRSGVEESRSRRIVDVSRLLGFTFPETLSRILVVGGGQSAAECLNYLLDKFSERPVRIDWLTSETSFRALDTSNFSREMFSTAYAQVFSSLTGKAREKINNDDKSVANGMLPLLAQALYQRLYQLRHLPGPEKARPTVHVQANTEVVEVRENPSGVSVKASIVSAGKTDVADYDCVILCTGLDDETILESSVIGPELRRRIEKNQDRTGYAVTWDGPSDRMIFVQSQNKDTHGLGDSSFVTAPGRNAAILNSIAGREIYKIDESDLLVALR
ncbi:MAG TPA: SidA/IucD/PvdA family monooxygenase [Methyloceanibacter sp.]|nr:SidA/IucD/PvdA family monooxygenase [Methyloceanibacter sp.]